MVATADYGDEYRMLKKLAVGHLLNINTQKQNRRIRENALFNILDAMFLDLKNTSPHSGGSVIDARDYIKRAICPVSMFQDPAFFFFFFFAGMGLRARGG
ncbi:unnamed protein product [Sphagnum troendelagicum]